MYYGFDDYFEPGEFDEKIEELKNELRESVKKEINDEIEKLRKENKEIPLDYTVNIMESDEFLHLLSEEESPEEQLKALHHCLEKLPEEQRTSITRFFLEEMSYADIVEQTGFTLNNVKSYIQNGKRNLKNCIKKQAL